jgi:hypothetical protein
MHEAGCREVAEQVQPLFVEKHRHPIALCAGAKAWKCFSTKRGCTCFATQQPLVFLLSNGKMERLNSLHTGDGDEIIIDVTQV